MFDKRRRILGRDHHQTLATSANLAVSLKLTARKARRGGGGPARGTCVANPPARRRSRGALISVSNLASSLSRCGQQTEAEQILSATLALSRRTLGPTHELTLNVL